MNWMTHMKLVFQYTIGGDSTTMVLKSCIFVISISKQSTGMLNFIGFQENNLMFSFYVFNCIMESIVSVAIKLN